MIAPTITDESSGVQIANPEYTGYLRGFKDGLQVMVDHAYTVRTMLAHGATIEQIMERIQKVQGENNGKF